MSMSPTASKIEALLFDLGGVVIHIDFDRAFRNLAQYSRIPISEFRNRFAMDHMYEKHERGEIDFSEYSRHLRVMLELDCADSDLAAGWNAIFTGEISETLALIESARKILPCFAFSNSNTVHREAWSTMYPRATGVFQKVFVSSDLGVRKPERRAFEVVADRMGVDSASILFFDDTEENVHGAHVAGLNSVFVQRPSDVKNALMAIGAIR